jgi:thiamine pyrophosphate-dependent acetolactate synthase large subunit-like protein
LLLPDHRELKRSTFKKTVVDQFTETLVTAGVTRIYGIVGDSLNVLTGAIRRQGKIEWLHIRHEELAAFAAGAEAWRCAPEAVARATCISLTASSTAIAHTCRC